MSSFLRGIIVLCLFNIFWPGMVLYGQNSNVKSSPGKVLPPPPEAASLGKFGDIPVGLYTGVPSISIPIYSIDINGYSLPIGISYHASGIKVEEISSSIGIGWALNAGGVISCNIRGVYDFDNDHGLFNIGNTIYSKYKDGSLLAAARGGSGANNPAGTPDHDLVKDMASGNIDGEPDEFSFSFGNRSGKFVFDENGMPRSIPYEPLKIVFDRVNNIFTITDEKGVRFIFSEVEQATIKNAPGSTVPIVDGFLGILNYTPTWYLKKIILPIGDEIVFNYQNISYSYPLNGSETKYDAPFGYGSSTMEQPSDELSLGVMEVNGGKRIASIESSRGHVVQFNYSTTVRKDLPGTYGLEDINVLYHESPITSWHLSQGYFSANANSLEPENFRLKLNSIQQSGNPAYVFEYNNSSLPSRKSKDQDYWGYFNGRGNATLVPKTTLESGEVLAGADRSVNPLTIQAGMLKKVTYPTAGSTEFLYEPNDYYFDGLERVYSTSSTPILTLNGMGTQTYTFTTGSGVSQGRIFFQSNVETNLPPGDVLYARLQGGILLENLETLSKQKTVALSPNTTYTLTLYSTADEWTGTNGIGRPLQATLRVEWLEGSNQQVNRNIYAGGLRVSQTLDKSSEIDLPKTKHYLYKAQQEDTKSSGYIVNEPVSSFYRTIYDLNPNQQSVYLPARTYVVRSSNSISALSSVKGSSVGYESVVVLEGANGENGKVVSKYSIYPDLMSHRPSTLGVISNSWPNVYASPTSYDFLRGLLMEETTYKRTSSGFSKVKQVNNKYKISNDAACFLPCEVQGPNNKNILAVKAFMIKPQPISIVEFFPVLGPGEFELMASYNISNWYQLDSTITKSFDTEGNNPIETVINYGYNNPIHAQLTSSTTRQSDGKAITTLTSYADDYLSGTAFLDNMRANHQIAVPIEQVSYKETGNVKEIIGGSLSTYKSGGKLLPDKIFQLENSSPILLSGFKFSGQALGQLPGTGSYSSYNPDQRYFETLSFNRYDNSGNLLSITKNSGSPTSYLYSYNNRYPVAEIKNADYASVEGTLGVGTIQAFNNQSNPDVAAVNSFLQPLKTTLPNAFITSYTYKPLVGMTNQIDAKGMTTYYTYDAFNRLENIKDQNGDIVKNYRYNYADGGTPPAGTIYKNREVTIYKTRNNCGVGQQSVPVAFTVPAGGYSSTESVDAADEVARAAEDALAQANANSLGVCTTPTPGTVSLNYSLPGTVQFKLRITNVATSAYTDHVLSSNGTLGNIQQGTVNLILSEMTTSGNSYNFSLNGVAKSGNSTSYDNFSFTATANLNITLVPASGPHYNTAQTISKTKTNCPSGTGTAVSYTVVANSYSSPTSVADANLLALAGGDAAAQANANALGGCTVGATTTYYSQLTLVTKSRNNCPSGVGGVPQTISYPLGAFSSLISVADADQQLHDAAQSSVNTNGGCAITTGTFTLNYSTNSTRMFTVHVKDAQGNTLNQPSIQGSRVLTGVPGGGTGSITLTPYPIDFPLTTGMTFSYSVNGSSVQTTTPAHFPGLTLEGTVNVTVTQTGFVNNRLVVRKTRNNCTSDQYGSQVEYIVEAGTHTSTISQADADAKAQANANANAQNYANTNGICTTPTVTYYSVAVSASFVKNNCPSGQTSITSYSYSVPYARYSSMISQTDANQKAQADIDANGQSYANAQGACIPMPFSISYSIPAGNEMKVYVDNYSTTSIYTISGTGIIDNIPGGTGEITVVPVNGGRYTFELNGTIYPGIVSYSRFGPMPLAGNMSLNIIKHYLNTEQTISKTRNNCQPGYTGSAVSYTVAANTYSSTISQADADQQARTGEDANAQANANTNGTCTPPPTYYSAYLSVSKTRNNCTVGYTGTTVTYVVNNGKYTSLISQADANQKAQADADANAQSYANTNGTCKPPVTYYNTGVYRYLAKNNCPPGDVGSGVSYTVPAAKYSSLISQADADQQAQADLNANAQNYANTNGTCTTPIFTLNYSVPDDIYIVVKLHNPTLGLTSYHTIYGTGSLTNIRGGAGWSVDVYPQEENNIRYEYSFLNGGYLAWGTTASFGPNLYLSGNVSLTMIQQ